MARTGFVKGFGNIDRINNHILNGAEWQFVTESYDSLGIKVDVWELEDSDSNVKYGYTFSEDETCDDMWDDDEYTPSATRGDYSPSCPWNAPGMSIHDFI